MATKKPRQPVEGVERKTYQVLRNLSFDNVDYLPDGKEVVTVDLADDEAEPLLAVGVIQPMPEGAA